MKCLCVTIHSWISWGKKKGWKKSSEINDGVFRPAWTWPGVPRPRISQPSVPFIFLRSLPHTMLLSASLYRDCTCRESCASWDTFLPTSSHSPSSKLTSKKSSHRAKPSPQEPTRRRVSLPTSDISRLTLKFTQIKRIKKIRSWLAFWAVLFSTNYPLELINNCTNRATERLRNSKNKTKNKDFPIVYYVHWEKNT